MANPAHLAVLALITCACLEPPELDDLLAPLADLGGADSWGPLDGAPLPEYGGDGDAEGANEIPADFASTSNPALQQLLITEVLVDPEGKDGGPDSPEFIELQNTGTEELLLDGLHIDAQSWPVIDADQLGLTGLSLQPGAFLVVHRWTTSVDPALATPEISDSLTSVGFLHSGGLRNANGLVMLGSGPEPIDELVYGADPGQATGSWIGDAVDGSGSGYSMCRSTTEDHDDASDWSSCVPNPGQQTPTQADDEPVQALGLGVVQIVEVSANPPGPSSDEKQYEFIELTNMSEVEVELLGCMIGDDPSYDAPGVDPLEYFAGDGGCESPTCLAPGARAIIVGQGYAGPLGMGLVLATDDSTIADGGLTNTEPAILWDAVGAMASSYRLWPDPSGDPMPDDEQPLHRIDPAAPDEPQSWVSAPATPGE